MKSVNQISMLVYYNTEHKYTNKQWLDNKISLI